MQNRRICHKMRQYPHRGINQKPTKRKKLRDIKEYALFQETFYGRQTKAPFGGVLYFHPTKSNAR